MEEGSLLAEALNHARVGGTGDHHHHHHHVENALVVDVFLLPTAAATASAAAAGGTGTGKCNTTKEDIITSNSNSNSNMKNLLEQHLLDLANLGVRFNDFIMRRQQSDDTYYPWIQGGDGPVFGIHTSSSSSSSNDSDTDSFSSSVMSMIPHLRAICRYGVSVADEWKMIGLVLEFFKQHHYRSHQQDDANMKKNHKIIMVAECMDVDDGQILMIQGADALPEWADRIGPHNCRHRCWIRSDDDCKIHLIAPPPSTAVAVTKCPRSNNNSSNALSLSQALDCLLNSNNSNNNGNNDNNSHTGENACQYHAGVQEHVQQAIDRINNAKHCQRTALLVPRSVANLVQRRPDLAAAAYLAWAQQRQQQQQPQPHPPHGRSSRHQKQHQNDPQAPSSSDLLAGTCHDWIWTIDNRMSRTVHAMLRTIVSSGSPTTENANDDDWSRPDCIPKCYQSIEVKRLQRHVQSLPLQPAVLQSSLALGVRLVAGLQQLLQDQTKNDTNNSTNTTMQPRQSHVERRVLDYWSRVDRQCRYRGGNSATSATDTTSDTDNKRSNWLEQVWVDGPNHAQYNLESFMECPVFAEEVQKDDAVTPITHPDMTLADQIRHELLRQNPNNDTTDPSGGQGEIPRPDQVDTDEWMTLPLSTTDQDLLFQQTLGLSSFNNNNNNDNNNNKISENENNSGTASLDHMLHGFQDFMKGESGIEGVDHYSGSGSNSSKNNKDSQENHLPRQQQPIRIHPAAFLNLLHKSLAADSAQELETFVMGTVQTGHGKNDNDVCDGKNGGDYFFSEEDYRLAEPDNTDDDEDEDSSSNGENDDDMMDIMDAMDSQLLEHDGEALSRPGDGADVKVDDDALLDEFTGDEQHEDIVRDVHVLSNLIESLEAGAGAPGPVQNMLCEMSGK